MRKQHEQVDDPFVSLMDKYPQMDKEKAALRSVAA
jgi:endonuclease V-like protein UPF0215 family